MRIHYNIFDTLLEPVFVLNAEQKVIYCNETAATMCELSIRKITRGMKFGELFTFSEPLEALKNLVGISDPTPYKELKFKSSQGGEGKVQITLQPVFDQMGDKAWVLFMRDVTLEERLQMKYRGELEQKEGVIKALEDAKIQLENYSKNLEVMVAERTRELSRLNQTMSALLDSLGQGFFIFNAEGLVLDVSSRACLNTIEQNPQGKQIWDILKLSSGKVDGFKKWMTTVFAEMLPFEDLAPLAPTAYEHSQGKSIALEYFPLRSSEGGIEGIVVVSSDITSLVEAQKQAQVERDSAKLIINIVQSKREITRFVHESREMINELNGHLDGKDHDFDGEAVFRLLHTLKGGAALFSISEMAKNAHDAETALASYRDSGNADQYLTLHEKSKAVEAAFNRFLDSGKNILGESAFSEERQIEVSFTKLAQMLERVSRLPNGGNMVQIVMSDLVMEPAGSFFTPYEDVARKVAEQQEKQLAPLEIINGELPILPEIYSSLFSTFVHAFRNAVDHGIEIPSEREKLGKAPQGKVRVSFEINLLENQQQMLLISVKDDGAGISPAKIREKFKERGVDLSHENDDTVIQHIFDSQFSTRSQVTEISGRGVGMDAIKVAAQAMGGKTWVVSQVGQGSELFVEVPYLTSLGADKVASQAA